MGINVHVHTVISNEQLAKQMTHAVSTADQFYNVANTSKEDVQMATFIKTVTGGKRRRIDDEEEFQVNKFSGIGFSQKRYGCS